MRNLINCFLIFVFFTGPYPLQQVMRLPLLVTHCLHHVRQHESTVADFYLEHYAGAETDDADDTILPFKKDYTTPVLSSFLTAAMFAPQPLPVQNISFPPACVTLVSAPANKHWQPPC